MPAIRAIEIPFELALRRGAVATCHDCDVVIEPNPWRLCEECYSIRESADQDAYIDMVMRTR